jgi:hypothetical protein
MLDKEGKQTHKFKPGTHSLALKAVDNEGLEAIEVVSKVPFLVISTKVEIHKLASIPDSRLRGCVKTLICHS